MSRNRLPLLAQRVLNTPLAIHPGKAELIVSALADRLGVNAFRPTAFWLDDDDDAPAQPVEPDNGYDVQEGVAVIPVCGTLVQKNYSVRPESGMTGYDGVRAAMQLAVADSDVRAIALEIDSPGGEVAGCFDLVDAIHKASIRGGGQKPIWGLLNEHAYSAAYAIASACDRITAPRTGGAGSIGVIAILAEMSGMLKREGVTVNIIQFGARKSDGNPYEALPAEARGRFQAQINTMGALFANTVARNRSMTPQAVTDLEAGTFMAAEARSLGLIDDVLSPDAAFAALLATL